MFISFLESLTRLQATSQGIALAAKASATSHDVVCLVLHKNLNKECAEHLKNRNIGKVCL
jgi:hypothetical protein